MFDELEPTVYVGHGYFDVNRHGLRCYGFRRVTSSKHPMSWTLLYPLDPYGHRTVEAQAVVDDFGDLVVVS
jgi:hypothetical protein